MSGKYGTGTDTQYCNPNSGVLIDKLGITDEAALELAEIELMQARIEQYEPKLDDIHLAALCHNHSHLFRDLYAWGGQLRTVDIAKGATRFANVSRTDPEAERNEN